MSRRNNEQKALSSMLSQLPTAKEVARDLTFEEAETLGANPCGESRNGEEVYKLLTREKVMLTFTLRGQTLQLVGKQRLFK